MPRAPWVFAVLFSRAANAQPGPPKSWPPWPGTSSLFFLERLPCPAPPWAKGHRPGRDDQLLEVATKDTKKDNPSLEQANECLHLSFFHPKPRPNLQGGLKQRTDIGSKVVSWWVWGGVGAGPSSPRNLSFLLWGPSVLFPNTYTAHFQNWSCLVFWFFLCCAFVPWRSFPNGY